MDKPRGDSVGTPKYMLDFCRKCLGLEVKASREDSWEDVFDPCPFQKNWNKKDHQDGLDLRWGTKVILNPPFSKSGKFIVKAIHEAKLGSKIVIICKNEVMQNLYAHKLHDKDLSVNYYRDTDKPIFYGFQSKARFTTCYIHLKKKTRRRLPKIKSKKALRRLNKEQLINQNQRLVRAARKIKEQQNNDIDIKMKIVATRTGQTERKRKRKQLLAIMVRNVPKKRRKVKKYSPSSPRSYTAKGIFLGDPKDLEEFNKKYL